MRGSAGNNEKIRRPSSFLNFGKVLGKIETHRRLRAERCVTKWVVGWVGQGLGNARYLPGNKKRSPTRLRVG